MKDHFYYSIRQISLLLIGALLYTASSAQGFSPQVQAKLQHIIDSFQNHSDTALIGGMSAAINVDGLALWKGASGYAARNIDEQNNLLPGGTPLTPDTLFRIYSVTKTFTAALTLELAHEGVFNLDDPESKYIPWIVIANPELNPNVTIRQLLAHESGYSDYLLDIQAQLAFAFDPTHVWTPFEILSFVHQIAAPGPPGVYSSSNYIVLGAIIEAATGVPVEQLFRERYFNKLQLNSMYLAGREPIDDHGNLAAPHDNISPFDPIFQMTGQPYTFPDTVTNISRLPTSGVESLAFTSGGIVSNVVDLTKWGNDLFGGRATSKAVLDTMLNSIPPYADAGGDHLGYGIFYNTKISATDTFIGHAGFALGYESLMYYQPNRKMTIAVLFNNAMADRYAVARMLYEALPDFLCGEKEKRVLVTFKGYTLCLPRPAAHFLIKRGAYLGGCGGAMIENTDSLLTAVLSKSELAALGIPKVISGKNELIAYPNPISKSAVLSFNVAQSGITSLRIYDMSGRQVSLLFNGMAESGVVRQVHFEAGKLPAGMYIAHLQTKDGTIQKKLVIAR
jgi:D-alanyl-D-alanine carboxypeptidase